MASWMKDQTSKAARVELTDDDRKQAASSLPSPPRTAPGQMMGLQAKVGHQAQEIERLTAALSQRATTKLPLTVLHEVPGRRRRLTPEAYGELRANLSKYPLSTPISVLLRPDGEYDIVAGNNRVSIYRELGREEIEALVLDIPVSMVEYVAFFSNLLSPSLSDFEKYWNFKKLQEGTKLSQTEIAEEAGLSKGHVSRIFAFDGLPAEAKELLATCPERLGSTAAQKLSSAAERGRANEVVTAIRQLVEDENFTQDQAVASVAPAATKPAQPDVRTVKVGRTVVCKISTRGGVVGLQFQKEEMSNVAKWAQDIEDFVQAKLKERTK
jgi:ParB family chromosome partitioning protein